MWTLGRRSPSSRGCVRAGSAVVALHFVVEDDGANPPALVANALLGALEGAIDLDVVRQLARFPQAGVERLAGSWVRSSRGLDRLAPSSARPPSVRTTARSFELRADGQISPSPSRWRMRWRGVRTSSRSACRSCSATTRNPRTSQASGPRRRRCRIRGRTHRPGVSGGVGWKRPACRGR